MLAAAFIQYNTRLLGQSQPGLRALLKGPTLKSLKPPQGLNRWLSDHRSKPGEPDTASADQLQRWSGMHIAAMQAHTHF